MIDNSCAGLVKIPAPHLCNCKPSNAGKGVTRTGFTKSQSTDIGQGEATPPIFPLVTPKFDVGYLKHDEKFPYER